MERDIWDALLDRRDFLKAGVLGATGLALAACGTAPAVVATPKLKYAKAQIDGDLVLFNWSQYMSPDVITAFGKHYGIQVHQPFFDNMTDMLTKLNSTAGPYDLTFPTMDYAQRLIAAGKLQPIDHSQLTNWSQVPAYFHNPWYDPHAYYTVPYAIWTTGITWRNDKVSGATGSWNDLFNWAAQYPGKVNLLDDYQEVLGMSLVRMGDNINSKKSSQVHKAADNVIAIKPDIRQFTTDDITPMENGNAWVHHAWSGDVWQVINSGSINPKFISYETCREGVPTGNDTMVIPANAQHPGTALKFIDWMLDPQNASTNVQYFGYPQVTLSGLDAYSKLVAQYPFMNLTLNEALHGLREIVPTGATYQLWQREWARVKAG